MAISTQTGFIAYAGNNDAGVPYEIPFPFFSADHIQVTLQASGETTAAALVGSDYTITRLEDGSGGSLYLNSAAVTGDTVRIRRVLPFTQPTTFQLAGPLPAPAIETALDRLAMQVQQLSFSLSVLQSRVAALDDGDDGEDVFSVAAFDDPYTEITLADPDPVDLLPGTWYRLKLTIGPGFFSDNYSATRLTCNEVDVVAVPECSLQDQTTFAWVILAPIPAFGTEPVEGLDFVATIRGRSFSGVPGDVTGTWTLEPIT